ncbi:MAG: DsbA family protein [Pseudomonadota bacterium]
MLEPEHNPNPPSVVDPPRILRAMLARVMSRAANTQQITRKRERFEKRRIADGKPHVVEYFHQLDDPYSHLSAQVLKRFADRYDVEIIPRLIRATGGKNQPESEKLATWARRDAELIAPHFGLSFPHDVDVTPPQHAQRAAASLLAESAGAEGVNSIAGTDFVSIIERTSTAMWKGELPARQGFADADIDKTLDQGSSRLKELGHYSGAMFYYGGEWYWGIDRLFHLEQRLRELGVCRAPALPYIAPRPAADLTGIDARQLALHFYPSLNSPYTAIIYDRTLALAEACQIQLHHKPVLPMVMRGVPATPTKVKYILFDTKREADCFGVPFGHLVSPIGTPTRQAYALLYWAKQQDKDRVLLSTLLRHAWSQGKGLHKTSNMRRAVEAAGLDWSEAYRHLDSDTWKLWVERNQQEMVNGMGLWGVPCFRVSGPQEEPDLSVWGQDRLWLVAAEIRRRSSQLSISRNHSS